MDSDSSQDGDNRNGSRKRDWDNRQNSDVSDDENFSRGAKSIDSPPESPPRGGGNLDSPPASPAQGVESPHSVYSGSRSGTSREGTPEYPQSPDSPSPNSPASSVEHIHSRDSGRNQYNSKNDSSSPECDENETMEEEMKDDEGFKSPDRGTSPDSNRGGRCSPDSVDRDTVEKERHSNINNSDSSPSKSPESNSKRDTRFGSPDSNNSQSDPGRIDSPYRGSSIYSPVRQDHEKKIVESTNNRSSPVDAGDSPKSDRSHVQAKKKKRHSTRGSPLSNSLSKFKTKQQNSGMSPNSEDLPTNSKNLHDKNTSGSTSSDSRFPKDVNFRSKSSGRHKHKSYNRNSPKRSDSDGRSNISSNSSIGSPASNKSSSPEPKRGNKTDKVAIKSHGEDLSDVSDIESLGSNSDVEQKIKETKKNCKEKEEKERKNGINLEETEQLDFEAEEVDSPSKKKDQDIETEEGEVKELEEGELSDEGEVRPEETEPRPICRFFSRGQCTWGSSCSFRHPEVLPLPPSTTMLWQRYPRPFYNNRGRGRAYFMRFVHPGVTDKGNYTMFDMVRPLAPPINNGPPPPHMYPPIDCYRPPMERPPMMGPPPYQQPIMRRGGGGGAVGVAVGTGAGGEEPPGESAWERGLRQAKEMLRRSSKRKETDVDFEEKKMTLGISGQEEYDKENDYYPRPSSPVYDEYHERTKESGEKRYRSVSDRFGDYPPAGNYYRDGSWYDDRSRYHHSSRHHSSGKEDSPHVTKNSEAKIRKGQSGYGGSRNLPEDYYESRSKKKYSSRDVVVQRGDKSSWKEGGSSPSARSRGGRGDEWADPWMRSKSPSRKGASRKKSYSSRSRSSSYSSSSSRSSSSYSSYSRSRSHSSRSRSRSSRSRSRSSFSKRKLSPLSRRAKSPFSRERRVGEGDRGMHMNPPPPSPTRATSPRRNPTPPIQPDRNSRNISARLLAAAMRQGSVSSRSSSGTDSSGSSSDSSSDSGSSSSSSSSTHHKHSRKKVAIDEKLAQAVKAKAMDALKLSGQKQQIKLTLKGTGSSLSERLPAPISRKRPIVESPNSEEDSSPGVPKKKSTPSRREELLKQLKAVEDAIARKKSKI